MKFALVSAVNNDEVLQRCLLGSAAVEEELTQDAMDSYSDLLTQIQAMKQARQRAIVVDDLTTNHPSVLKLDIKIQELLRQKLSLEMQHAALTNYVADRPRVTGERPVMRR